jgi:hypothetical protein
VYLLWEKIDRIIWFSKMTGHYCGHQLTDVKVDESSQELLLFLWNFLENSTHRQSLNTTSIRTCEVTPVLGD